MAVPIAYNVTTQGKQIWSGRNRGGDVNSLLLMNTDINNTVMAGSDLTAMVVPIAPNGSLAVDPSENWYVIGSVAGSAPLVVLPNGQNNFLGLTQGLGSLAIPSIHSPNFLTGVSGWSINKDGSAEFNNLRIRGNFAGPDFYISNGDGTLSTTPAFLFYSSTPPAVNTLVFSNSALDGSDTFGNHYFAGYSTYTGNGNTDLFTAMTQAGINWGTNQNGSAGTGHLKFLSPNGINSDTIQTWDPVAGYPTVESWHNITPINGWAVVNQPRYKLLNTKRVVLDGVLDGSAATAATMVTISASAYHPVTPNKFWPAGANAGVIAGQSPFWDIATTGSIAIGGVTLGTAGMHITLNGEYPLD